MKLSSLRRVREFLLLLGIFWAWPSQAALNLRILAKVADTSISNRDMILDWLLQNPKSYVQGRRNYFSQATEEQLLQQRIIQILVEEENRIVGIQSVSNADVDRELSRLKRGFGPRWNSFLQDFEVSELDVRKLVSSYLLVDQTLQVRLQDSLKGVSRKDQAAMSKAEDSLQTWLQQLRSRYRVQMFRYP